MDTLTKFIGREAGVKLNLKAEHKRQIEVHVDKSMDVHEHIEIDKVVTNLQVQPDFFFGAIGIPTLLPILGRLPHVWEQVDQVHALIEKTEIASLILPTVKQDDRSSRLRILSASCSAPIAPLRALKLMYKSVCGVAQSDSRYKKAT